MKIALIGYGKMGKAIEEIALERGHEVVLRIGRSNASDLSGPALKNADIAIEFSSPECAFENVKNALQAGVPVVCGSTGWTDQLEDAKKIAVEQKTGLIYASNFSIGVNIFFEVNKRLAVLMANREEYEVSLEEIHHTQKKDAPSGTAISLANQLIEFIPRKKQWVNEKATKPQELEIISRREDPAPGTHHVRYESPVDRIEIVHTAHSRKGFAAGAVLAAEFLRGRSGFFSMKDVLQL